MTKGKVSIISALLLFVISGCSSTTNWPQFSGFLDDYTGMHRSSEIEGVFLIKHGTKNVNDYSKFLVGPVNIRLTPDAKAYSMSKTELEKIARSFRNDIIRALKTNHTVVNKPGKGVLLVHVAITDILKSGSSGSAKGIVEAAFIDTSTKERIAAVLTSDKGMYFDEWAGILRDRLHYLNSATKVYKFE